MGGQPLPTGPSGHMRSRGADFYLRIH